jgi:enoyl-CoA hydratase
VIHTAQHGRVVLARVDNPPHALMTNELVDELDRLVRHADADPTIGAVVLTGAHPDRFIAHFDIRELLTSGRAAPPLSPRGAAVAIGLTKRVAAVPGAASVLARTPAAGLLALSRFHDILLRMGRSGTVFIAAINGATAGGGMELSLACDLRYLSDDGELAQPELALGFPPGGGGTQRMARLIGRAAALEIMLSCRSVSAAEAKALGLVTEVFPREHLVDSALEVAHRLAARYKPGVAALKRAVIEGASGRLEDGLRLEQSVFVAMLGESEVQTAMTAYVDHLERTGIVPAFDDESRHRLLNGSFSPFNRGGGD